jgi:hypothetical protein
MVFTVTPRLASATAKYRTDTSIAAFAAPIATQGCQLPNRPPGANVIATILPPLDINGAASRAPTRNALACESTAVSHFSNVISIWGLVEGRRLRSCIADENIERAELGTDVLEDPADLIRLANVGLDQKTVRPEFADPFQCRKRRIPIAVIMNPDTRSHFRQF